MYMSNKRLNQSVDLSQSYIFDADKSHEVTGLGEDDGYLRTERGQDEDEEPDYRQSSRNKVETESLAASELRADQLEFLR